MAARGEGPGVKLMRRREGNRRSGEWGTGRTEDGEGASSSASSRVTQ